MCKSNEKVLRYSKICRMQLIVASMFHVSDGIVQKIEFEIRPNLGCTVQPSKRREKWFRTIRLCVRLSICLAVAFLANSHMGVRVNHSS